ncbi:MAG: ammonium transporter [SAR86 cluster bacterium]|uniref:Ammonium transporter n=1 Tax=SAR86 cluster bacterium TaxID=2030880 RepID=A0A520N5A9_9GAMM|nr:MAG: ammonium transporter [SAR86 cluster bacterium]
MEEIKFALDTFYAVMAGALVMWMAAGFTMLEAGLVQKKDVSEIVTKNLGLYSIACIMYLVCGFMLMYPGGAFMNFLPQIGSSWSLSLATEASPILYGSDGSIEGGDFVGYYSHQADFFFQVVFVATAMSIVSGAVAGRMKLLPFFMFAIILTGFIYPIQGYWNWGGGFLSSNGYSDYAGSGTVHLCGAAAALAVVMVLGPRKGKYSYDGSSMPMPGSNIPMAALGAWILWLGWFGFNGGSELKVSEVDSATAVSQVFLNTNMAAAGGVVAALMMSLFKTGKMDVTMAINGAIAGLVAITAGPSAPTAGAAVLIGAAGGVLVYFSILYMDTKLKLDDPVGAISAHGTVGILGVMVVPFTSDASFVMQAIGVISIAGFTFLMSLATVLAINLVMPIRATDEEQDLGLDVSEIGVEAYPEFK